MWRILLRTEVIRPWRYLVVADQGPVLPLPGRGLVGLWDHVQDQEFGQDLGIQAVGLLGALGNHPQLLGIGQHDLLGQRLYVSTNQR